MVPLQIGKLRPAGQEFEQQQQMEQVNISGFGIRQIRVGILAL